MKVFSYEHAAFFASLLAQGLSQARPEQIVGFTVSPSAWSSPEPIAGILYVYQGVLYLTIAHFSARKTSSFLPSSAVGIKKTPPYVAMRAAGALPIDY